MANLHFLGFIFKELPRIRGGSVLRFLLCCSNVFPQIKLSSLLLGSGKPLIVISICFKKLSKALDIPQINLLYQ